MTNAEVDSLTDRIIGCGIEVHRTLGAGLLESIYRECLLIELGSAGLGGVSEQRAKLEYKGTPLRSQFRVDLVVEQCIVVELKAIEKIHPVHISQVITYLKLTGHPAGLIMNFNVSSLRQGLRRVNHPDRHASRKP